MNSEADMNFHKPKLTPSQDELAQIAEKNKKRFREIKVLFFWELLDSRLKHHVVMFKATNFFSITH